MAVKASFASQVFAVYVSGLDVDTLLSEGAQSCAIVAGSNGERVGYVTLLLDNSAASRLYELLVIEREIIREAKAKARAALKAVPAKRRRKVGS